MLPINTSQAYDSYKLGHFTLTQMLMLLYFTVWMVYLFLFILLDSIFCSAVLTCFYARIVHTVVISVTKILCYFINMFKSGLCINKSLLFLNLQPPQSESAPQ